MKKATIIAVSVAAAIAFSPVAADARKVRILKDTKDGIGWRFTKKTKTWKRMRVIGGSNTLEKLRQKHKRVYEELKNR